MRKDEAPSKEEVLSFCRENNLNIDVDKFYSLYSRYGFIYRGAPIDWKAKAREWDKTEFKGKRPPRVERTPSEVKDDMGKKLVKFQKAYKELFGETFDIVQSDDGKTWRIKKELT